MRVVDLVDDARLAHEALEHLALIRQVRVQHLHRRAPAEDAVLGLVHAAVTARGDQPLEGVLTRERDRQ
jgi:hypothetical protein